jgi:dienelactone hydrolase
MVLLTVSCATRTHITYDARAGSADASIDTTRKTDPHFHYDPKPIEVDNHVLDRNRRYEVRRLSFGSIGDNGQIDDLVTIDYHRSRVPGVHPVVIVLPIWGRHVYPSNAITRTLRKRSNGAIHILDVTGDDFLIDWPKLGVVTDEDEFLEIWAEGAQRELTTLIDMRRLIDWAENQPEIDGDHIGLIGFSHGAIFAPTLATQEPRISTLVLVMGGAHPQRVAAQCAGARTEGIQIWAAETFGWSRDEMEERLEPLYGPLDPASYPDRVDPARVLIIEAGKDECMPESSREALWEVMGRPERHIIHSNHRHAFYTMTPLNLNWMRKKIWKFYKTHLLTPAEE